MLDLIARARGGDRRAAARIITELECAGPDMPALLAAFEPVLGRAPVIGVTGPPGAGKSTLVDAWVQTRAARGERVAILAVDPSSPVSGGAILGDRIRMAASLGHETVTMRSLASQGALGGLSPAAVRVIDALEGLGHDVIVLETVGTGQNEIDVTHVADVRVVLAAPGLGDGIQAMKSGLLEIADIIVVNQADRPGADETKRQLFAALSLRSDANARAVPVLSTIATTGEGLDALDAAINDAADRALRQTPAARRERRGRYLLERALHARADVAARDDPAATTRAVEDLLAGRTTATAAAKALLSRALERET
jgi:LAO/AO transport system kinase